jgi:IS30 family transposase
MQRLQAHWSPETIEGRLKLDFPADTSMRLSHETIYRWLYLDATAGGQLYRCLRWQHKRRRKQRRYGSLRGLIPGRVSIGQRPAAVDRTAASGIGRVTPSMGAIHAIACSLRSSARAAI